MRSKPKVIERYFEPNFSLNIKSIIYKPQIYIFRVQTNNKVNNPKTGDNIVTYIVIGVVAILVIIVCAVMYLKKKKDNK